MAVSYITQANANSASSQVSSKTITIPSTVQASDVLLLVAQCYSGSGGNVTISIASTGSSWSQQGTQQYVAGTSSQNNASLYYLSAGASDASKVVTISTASALFYNLTMVVYRGSSTTWDGSNVTSSTTLTTTDTCPNITTALSGTWLVCLGALCNGSAGFSSCTGPANASSVREANFGSNSGIAVASDSNGAVSAGSQTPGHFTPSTTADYITWTLGLAVAGATAAGAVPYVLSQNTGYY
jgi:hypothetical protein